MSKEKETVRKSRPTRSTPSTETKKPDGRTVEGKKAKLRSEYADICNCYASVKAEHETLLGEVKHLQKLLAAFNAHTVNGKVVLTTPAVGTSYYYVRVNPTGKNFEVVPCEWRGYRSDLFRYVQGNMYLDLYVANTVCQDYNFMLSTL